MIRTISLTIGIAAAALAVGAPTALGDGRYGSQEPILAQPDPMIEDGFAQAVAAKKALQRSPVVSQRAVEPQWLTAERLRSEALNKKYGLGGDAPVVAGSPKHADLWNYESRVKVADTSPGVLPQDLATIYADSDGILASDRTSGGVPRLTTANTNPEFGIGLVIGLVSALGLALILRVAHVRPFAH
jgi:hypothetical protein